VGLLEIGTTSFDTRASNQQQRRLIGEETVVVFEVLTSAGVYAIAG
jgi:hypothetical protein